MRRYLSILFKPEDTFLDFMSNDDGKHSGRINFIIFLASLLRFLFGAIYDFLDPFDYTSPMNPIRDRIIGFLIPAVFGVILGFIIFKFAIPFIAFEIGKYYSKSVDSIHQVRFIVALSLIPIILVSPLSVNYFIENIKLLILINSILILASIISIRIIFVGIKLLFQVDSFKSLLIISPYLALFAVSWLIS